MTVPSKVRRREGTGDDLRIVPLIDKNKRFLISRSFCLSRPKRRRRSQISAQGNALRERWNFILVNSKGVRSVSKQSGGLVGLYNWFGWQTLSEFLRVNHGF